MTGDRSVTPGEPAAADDPTVAAGPGAPTSAELVEHYDAQYAKGGFGYDEKRETWARWLERNYVREFDLRPGERLLDVGCGDGFWTGLFAEVGFKATGIDLSPGGIEVARRTYPEATFEVGDAEDLPFPDDSFDIVFCRAISHLSRPDLRSDASARLVAELRRVVAPRGLVLISYYTRRDGGGTPEHAWHRLSDLVRLLELELDPSHVDVVGHYVQIAAQRWDSPRRPRSDVRSASPAAGRRGSRRRRIVGLLRRASRAVGVGARRD